MPGLKSYLMQPINYTEACKIIGVCQNTMRKLEKQYDLYHSNPKGSKKFDVEKCEKLFRMRWEK